MLNIRATWKVLGCLLVATMFVMPVTMAILNKGRLVSKEPSMLPGDNLVPNPSFEEGVHSPTGWQHKSGLCGHTKYMWDSTFSYYGNKSVGISDIDRTCNVNTHYWFTENLIPINPLNNSYKLSLFYRYIGTPSRWPEANVIIWTYDAHKDYNTSFNISIPYSDGNWHSFEYFFIEANDSTQYIFDGAAFIRVGLCAQAYTNDYTDAEIRFDSLFFGIWNNQQQDPPSISGITDGETGEDYEYTLTVSDPDNNMLYLYVDWGDGTNSGWIGPYASGEEVILTHSWTSSGDYTIKARTIDVYGQTSPWGMLDVGIAGIEIQQISGGFGITIDVINTASGVATNIPWSIDIEASNVFFGQYSEGVISSLDGGETTRIRGTIMGLGQADIYISVNDQSAVKECTMIGPFVIGV